MSYTSLYQNMLGELYPHFIGKFPWAIPHFINMSFNPQIRVSMRGLCDFRVLYGQTHVFSQNGERARDLPTVVLAGPHS